MLVTWRTIREGMKSSIRESNLYSGRDVTYMENESGRGKNLKFNGSILHCVVSLHCLGSTTPGTLCTDQVHT